MKKTILGTIATLLLSSCTVITVLDSITSSIIGIFVYNEKEEQLYKFTAESQKLDIKLSPHHFYKNDDGKQVINYDNVPQEYRHLLVTVK